MGTERFTPEFKEEAVRQVRDRGHSVAEISARLGVSSHSLYKWVKAVTPDKSEKQATDLIEAKSEILKLRAQLRRTEEERDILKKAAVSSTGPSNVLCRIALEADDGSNGKAGSLTWPEEGIVVSLEGRSVPIGNWSRAWQARGLDTWRAASVWWYRSANAIPI